MANVDDVAAYILKIQGRMTAMKLQKLVYYCQAWSLVWDEKPLFRARIEAWANGPVVSKLYHQHKGKFEIREWNGEPAALSDCEKDTINAVLGYYGDKSSQWLSELTHRERPWREAREWLPADARGNQEITHAALHEYYSGLT